MTRIGGDDARLIWSGALSLEHGSGWVKPWRVPHADIDLYSPGDPALAVRAEMPSGVRLRLGTDADRLLVETEPLVEPALAATQSEAPLVVDLYSDGVMVAQAELVAGQTRLQFEGLPAGDKVLEFWLPQFVPFALRSIDVPDGARVYHEEDLRPRWVVYGSSITHCRTAASPSFTWPGIVRFHWRTIGSE